MIVLLILLLIYIVGVIVTFFTIRSLSCIEYISDFEALKISLGSWITYYNLYK